jgi:hypothetical protein
MTIFRLNPSTGTSTLSLVEKQFRRVLIKSRKAEKNNKCLNIEQFEPAPHSSVDSLLINLFETGQATIFGKYIANCLIYGQTHKFLKIV